MRKKTLLPVLYQSLTHKICHVCDCVHIGQEFKNIKNKDDKKRLTINGF